MRHRSGRSPRCSSCREPRPTRHRSQRRPSYRRGRCARRENWVTAQSGFVGKQRAGELFERYGTRASEVIDAIDSGEDAPLRYAPEFSVLEIEHIVATESVVHIADLLLRRTSLAFTGDVSVELLEELAEIAAGVLGWTQERRADEIRHATALLASAHGVRLTHAGDLATQ